VAVPLPAELRQELAAWVSAVRRDGALDADWRWVDPDGWHITLAFLGATSPESLPALLESLAAATASAAPFALATGGLGAFPGRRRARVLWYGVHDREYRLRQLAAAVRLATRSDEASPFRAHVTLARSRNRWGAILPALPVDTLPSGRVSLSVVQLMRSHRGRGPAHYETLGEVPLGGRATVGVHP
jgi:2'-5' RNA ligase